MKFVPHAYQQYAINYIKSHPITALLLDMGLGKTVTTLTAIRGEGHLAGRNPEMGSPERLDLFRCRRQRGRTKKGFTETGRYLYREPRKLNLAP